MSEAEIDFIPDFPIDNTDAELSDIGNLVDKVMANPGVSDFEKEKKSMRCIIVDIDGTLSNCVPRIEFNDKKKLNWKKFFGEMEHDLPNDWCVRLTQIYYQMGFVVYIVSGRPDEYRKTTENWLNKWSIPYDFLYMRPKGDNRQDRIVKKEILERDLPSKELIEFVVDDRTQVVDMWREEGLTCLQCAPHVE